MTQTPQLCVELQAEEATQCEFATGRVMGWRHALPSGCGGAASAAMGSAKRPMKIGSVTCCWRLQGPHGSDSSNALWT